MLKKLIYPFIIALLSINSYGQRLTFEYQQGKGNYQMEDLKTFNRLLLENMPITPKLTENFPAYFYFQGEVSSFFNNVFGVGAVYSIQSTGARISLKDYSGEYRLDELIRSEAFALKWKFKIDSLSNFKMQFYAETGLLKTAFKVNEYFELFDQTNTEEYKLNSISMYLEPSLNISYPYKFLELGANLGYTFEFARGELKKAKGYANLPLNIAADETARSGWEGFRLGLFLRFNLF